MSAARARGAGVVDALLNSLPSLCLVVGKGGVGKTTCAVGLTACFAGRHERTLVVSTDPAGSLGTVLGVTLVAGEQREIPELPGCAVLQLDARSARQEFLARWRAVIVTILDRGTYLDEEDIEGLVDAAFPGGDEIFALLALAELVSAPDDEPHWQRIVIDTAPTGHTLRLLALPETFDALIGLLDAMQGKHRFMVTALTHRYRSDAADDFLATMRGSLRRLRSSLGDQSRAAAVVIARAEDVVVRETLRYAQELERLHVAVAAIVVDALGARPDPVSRHAMKVLATIGRAVFALPRLDPPPVGVAAIAALMTRLRAMPWSERGEKSMRMGKDRLRGRERSDVALFSGGRPQTCVAPALLRTLTIVGGKGGVGKTTVACALAISAASATDVSQPVLLVSTDPAPSVGDALGLSDPAWARRGPEHSPDLRRLDVWQMDATAAFDDLRSKYRDRIDALFDALVGRGIDVAQDRAIMRDLLALAPPGIDELYALSALGEILEENRYSSVIVDPAPTGHLLRLLEMPAIALDWAHRLMRLILKYREIAGLGEAAQELMSFSRRTRALDRLLHDPVRAGVVLVSLSEPVVEAESARLAETLENEGITVLAWLVNRTRTGSESNASLAPVERVITAPESTRPLVGVDVISDWCQRWERRD